MNLEIANAIYELVGMLEWTRDQLEKIDRNVATEEGKLKEIQMGPYNQDEEGIRTPQDENYEPPYAKEQSQIGIIKALKCQQDHLKMMKGELQTRIKKFETSEH